VSSVDNAHLTKNSTSSDFGGNDVNPESPINRDLERVIAACLRVRGLDHRIAEETAEQPKHSVSLATIRRAISREGNPYLHTLGRIIGALQRLMAKDAVLRAQVEAIWSAEGLADSQSDSVPGAR